MIRGSPRAVAVPCIIVGGAAMLATTIVFVMFAQAADATPMAPGIRATCLIVFTNAAALILTGGINAGPGPMRRAITAWMTRTLTTTLTLAGGVLLFRLGRAALAIAGAPPDHAADVARAIQHGAVLVVAVLAGVVAISAVTSLIMLHRARRWSFRRDCDIE